MDRMATSIRATRVPGTVLCVGSYLILEIIGDTGDEVNGYKTREERRDDKRDAILQKTDLSPQKWGFLRLSLSLSFLLLSRQKA